MSKLEIIYDLHVHSVASDGIHTVMEILEIARQRGLKGINISDHGKELDPSYQISGNFVREERMPSRAELYQDVILLKGVEANLLEDGTYDILTSSNRLMPYYHLVTVGIHSQNRAFPTEKGIKYNTDRLLKCIKNNPVDILAHPCIKEFPIEIPVIVKLAVEKGIALEINNTNLRLGKTDLKQLELMLKLAQKNNCRVVANSDGHTWFEIGCFEKVEEFIGQVGFPTELILNTSEVKVLNFITERKSLRQKNK